MGSGDSGREHQDRVTVDRGKRADGVRTAVAMNVRVCLTSVVAMADGKR